MPEDNQHGNQNTIANGTSGCSSPKVIEFNWPLYVYQRRARGGGEFLFTIGAWNGTRLLPICHLQPFQAALGALGEALIKVGRSQSVSVPSAGYDSNGLNGGHHPAALADAKPLSAADDNGQR